VSYPASSDNGPGRGLSPALIAILGVALVLRLATIVATSDYVPTLDSADYVRHAISIADGDGFPDSTLTASGGPSAFRPPLYPYLLGGVYAIAGDDAGETVGRVVGALLSTAAVWLLYLIGARVWGRRVGLIAAAGAAILPPTVFINTALISEPLFVCLMLASLLATLVARDRGGDWRWAALAGVCCALAALTRSNGVLLLIPALIGVWVVRPRWTRSALAGPAALLVAAALTVAPWTIRNTVEFGGLVPISTQSGFAMAGLLNDEARTLPGYPASWVLPEATERYGPLFHRRDLNEAELDRKLRREALDYAADHPGYVVSATVRNLLRTFDLAGYLDSARIADRDQLGIGARTAGAIKWTTFALDLLSIAGIVVLLARPRDERGPWFIWLIPVLMIVAAVWLIGSTRYRIPAYPFMILLGALAIEAAWLRLRQRAPASPGAAPDTPG
jgi:4-amino-4-deoxy-L-arabinose transferase-like glycosyltransferase